MFNILCYFLFYYSGNHHSQEMHDLGYKGIQTL